MCVCVFIKLHITAQSGSVILVILCHSGGINDTCYENLSLCVCVVIPFILDVQFIGRTSRDYTAQEESHTGFLHLLFVVFALVFLAKMIQPLFSLVDREAEFCVLTS